VKSLVTSLNIVPQIFVLPLGVFNTKIPPVAGVKVPVRHAVVEYGPVDSNPIKLIGPITSKLKLIGPTS
jgi:hypothetical protein